MTEWSRALLVSALAYGCSTTSSQFDGTVYQNESTRFSVGALPGWTRVEETDSNLAFRRDGMGVIGVHSSCEDYEDVTPQVLANHLLFGTTERKYVLDETAPVDGRDARHVLVEASLDGVRLELEIFVLVRDGCVYDLTHARPAGSGEPVRGPFLEFVGAFAVLDGPR